MDRWKLKISRLEVRDMTLEAAMDMDAGET